MLRATGVLCVVAALLGMMPGLAAAKDAAKDDEQPKTLGIYATLGAMISKAAFDLPSEVGQQDSWGLDTRVGYRFYSHLAAELQYQWAARFQTTSGGVTTDTISTNTLTGNLKVLLMEGPLEPYILLGLGFVNANFDHANDHTELAFRAGGGVHVFFYKNFGAYAEITYLKPFTALSDLNTVPIVFGGIVKF